MKTLLLLHGALGSKKQFIPLKSLLDENFQIHIFNFEGHGGNSSDKAFSNKLFCQNILDYMSENSIEKAHFFGYSMGGYVALYMAGKYPDKIDKIMTLATKFDWTPESAAREVKMLNPEIIEEKVPKFAAILKARHQPLGWKKVLQNTAEMMLALGSGAALGKQDFSKINNEILISVGDSDRMVSIEESKTIADILPKGRLKIIEGFEHPLEKVDAQKLSDIIKAFMIPETGF